MLFATLDPTLRAIDLPSGEKAILSDTVGFISDLPTMLVAAFRATLEEVIEADVILHVRDVSHEDTEAQMRDVEKVLHELGIEDEGHERLIEVWNKIDLLDADARAQLVNLSARMPQEERPVLVSAVTGEGLDRLAGAIAARLSRRRIEIALMLDPADGAGISWLHRNTEVVDRHAEPDGRIAMTVRADAAKAEQVRAKFGAALAH
jgi:GTP-binding protein HflX